MADQFLLSVIGCLLACAVAIQTFFAARVWAHERRLTRLEAEHNLNHQAGRDPAPACRHYQPSKA